MNKILVSGSFRKVAFKEGGSFLFKVGVKRGYKNKEGKYDYDNISVYIPSFNKVAIDYAKSYINDGDSVEIEGHVSTYATEKDGNKAYHQDLVCDTIRITGKGEGVAPKGNLKEDGTSVLQGEIEVNDTDIPW